MHGYKAHVATDQDAGLIRGVEVTAANVHDAAELATILPEGAGGTYGDSAYQGSRLEGAIRAKGGTSRIVHIGTWCGTDALTRLQAHNKEATALLRLPAVLLEHHPIDPLRSMG